MCEPDGKARDELPLYFEKLHSIPIVVEGELTAEMDGKPYRLSCNGFADIIDAVSFGVNSVSCNLRACHLSMTGNFFGSAVKNRPPFPFPYMLGMREHPVATAGDEMMPFA